MYELTGQGQEHKIATVLNVTDKYCDRIEQSHFAFRILGEYVKMQKSYKEKIKEKRIQQMMYSLSDEEDDEFVVQILKENSVREYCINILD
jgi:tRNA/tmRNA/rRNA uracil-C5-methylase (TrmA/RlmC/RlmD family)